MKIAIFSDVHDNLARWAKAQKIIKDEKIQIGICCGDVQNIETLEIIAQSFKKLYLCFGNADFDLRTKTGLIPENVDWQETYGETKIDKLKIAFIHNDLEAKALAENEKYNIVFYGHTHTPWEEKIRETRLINPGEIAGRYGKASFAIMETTTGSLKLEIID